MMLACNLFVYDYDHKHFLSKNKGKKRAYCTIYEKLVDNRALYSVDGGVIEYENQSFVAARNSSYDVECCSFSLLYLVLCLVVGALMRNQELSITKPITFFCE